MIRVCGVGCGDLGDLLNSVFQEPCFFNARWYTENNLLVLIVRCTITVDSSYRIMLANHNSDFFCSYKNFYDRLANMNDNDLTLRTLIVKKLRSYLLAYILKFQLTGKMVSFHNLQFLIFFFLQ